MIAAVALFIVAADNDPLWNAAWRATYNDEHRLAILSTLFALVFATLTTVLSFALGTKLLRAAAALLLVLAASCGFFMTQYGVVIDQSMIRNTVETTVLEATPLLSPAWPEAPRRNKRPPRSKRPPRTTIPRRCARRSSGSRPSCRGKRSR